MNAAVVLSVAAAATELVVAALLWTLGGFEAFRRVRWFAGLAVGAALFSITNLAFSLPGTAASTVQLAATLGGFAAAGAAICWLLYARVRRGLPVFGGVDTLIAGLAALAALLCVVPGAVYREALITVPVPWLGLSYRIPQTTSLALVAYAAFLVPLIASARHLRDVGPRVGRWLHLAALVSIFLAGVNEALVSAGLIQSPYLLELTYALMMLAVGYEAVETFADRSRKLAELSDALQDEVEQRTRELLAAQQQALRNQQLAGLGRLAAGVAHEINNPLSYVQSSLDYLGERLEAGPGGEADDVVEAIHDAKDGVGRVARIVRDLRAMTPSTRAAAGIAGASPHKAEGTTAACARSAEGPVALGEAIAQAVKLSAHVVEERGATVEVEVPEGLWVACGDEPLVRALSNLFCNAAQATQPGRPNRLTVAAQARDDQTIALRVRDTGRGIAPEQLPFIFEPFFSGRNGEGMGLGLAITHALLIALGGEVEVESELDVGTTFRLLLPRAEEPAPQTTENEMSERDAGETAQGRRIVLVDDEPLVARSLARLLFDDEVEIFTDPEQARARLLDAERPAVDAVLCDRHMAPCSGAELQGQIREADAALARRFIFISGDTFDEVETSLEDETPFVAKPVDLELLRAAIEGLPPVSDKLARALG